MKTEPSSPGNLPFSTGRMPKQQPSLQTLSISSVAITIPSVSGRACQKRNRTFRIDGFTVIALSKGMSSTNSPYTFEAAPVSYFVGRNACRCCGRISSCGPLSKSVLSMRGKYRYRMSFACSAPDVYSIRIQYKHISCRRFPLPCRQSFYN